MTLQDKIKEIAAKLDKETPCPISGACFSEVMTSEAGLQLLSAVAYHSVQNCERSLEMIQDENYQDVPRATFGFNHNWWAEFTGASNDNKD